MVIPVPLWMTVLTWFTVVKMLKALSIGRQVVFIVTRAEVACAIKLFTTLTVAISQYARVFAIAIYFHPCLICMLGELARVEPLMGLYFYGYTLSLDNKTRMEVTDSGQHSSLSRNDNNYRCKKL
jgi:hypothetical protein